jgi:hypothetical protein
MKDPIFRGGLRLIVSEDGILMRLIASDGNTLDVDMLPIIEELDPIDARTMVLWCRDRVREAAAFDLPDDVRESLESRIDEIAAPIALSRV